MSKIAPEIVEINPFLSSFEIHCYYRTSESGPTEQTAKSVTFTLTEVDAKVSVYQKHLMAVVKQMTGSSPLPDGRKKIDGSIMRRPATSTHILRRA